MPLAPPVTSTVRRPPLTPPRPSSPCRTPSQTIPVLRESSRTHAWCQRCQPHSLKLDRYPESFLVFDASAVEGGTGRHDDVSVSCGVCVGCGHLGLPDRRLTPG